MAKQPTSVGAFPANASLASARINITNYWFSPSNHQILLLYFTTQFVYFYFCYGLYPLPHFLSCTSTPFLLYLFSTTITIPSDEDIHFLHFIPSGLLLEVPLCSRSLRPRLCLSIGRSPLLPESEENSRREGTQREAMALPNLLICLLFTSDLYNCKTPNPSCSEKKKIPSPDFSPRICPFFPTTSPGVIVNNSLGLC